MMIIKKTVQEIGCGTPPSQCRQANQDLEVNRIAGSYARSLPLKYFRIVRRHLLRPLARWLQQQVYRHVSKRDAAAK